MLPEEIKHYILTLKHSQEMHEVIHHPLKRTLNREIKPYGIVLNEIQKERGSPRIKNISFKFGYNKREHKLKYRQNLPVLSLQSDLIGTIIHTSLSCI